MTQFVMAESDKRVAIIERPVDHIWDRDGFFRNEPEQRAPISKMMRDLKEQRGMEIYLVIYSSLIGEKPASLANRCHDAWLGEQNEGLVIVVVFNEKMGIELGRSTSLYGGHFIEQGLLPRISYPNLREIIMKSIDKVEEGGESEKMRALIQHFTESIKKRLDITDKEEASRESYHFMGWMALALLTCGILMGLLSKLIGTVDQRSSKSYSFPDFTVAQRLNASYGGGKISVLDFNSSSE